MAVVPSAMPAAACHITSRRGAHGLPGCFCRGSWKIVNVYGILPHSTLVAAPGYTVLVRSRYNVARPGALPQDAPLGRWRRESSSHRLALIGSICMHLHARQRDTTQVHARHHGRAEAVAHSGQGARPSNRRIRASANATASSRAFQGPRAQEGCFDITTGCNLACPISLWRTIGGAGPCDNREWIFWLTRLVRTRSRKQLRIFRRWRPARQPIRWARPSRTHSCGWAFAAVGRGSSHWASMARMPTGIGAGGAAGVHATRTAGCRAGAGEAHRLRLYPALCARRPSAR